MPAAKHLAGFVAAALLSAGPVFAAEKTDKAGVDFFEKHIRPVLVAKCYQCHAANSNEIKGGLLLDSRDGMRKGGDTGPAVVAGNVDDSILIEALRHEGLEMPPEEKLPDSVIAKFEQWVAMGAPDPRDGKSSVSKREIDFAKAREFWAFKPIRRPETPKVADAAWPRNDVDRFVLAKLEASNIKPVGDADRVALVRRIYFDLIGLPPTPDDVEQFASASAADPQKAVADLVDNLLAMPQFGERWGRHWLDVVRYAESTGMERNFTYPQAWRYRDYVISSFNADKPFDRFVREQVAGDLLPADSAAQRREQLLATGMLTLGPKGLNETDKEQFVMDVVDEQVDSTFRAFMGLTAGCARCHDHKFDPIPSKEYYALAGIFLSTDIFYGTPAIQGNRNAGRLLAMVGDDVIPFTPDAPGGKRGKGKAKSGSSAVDLKKDVRETEEKLVAITKRAASTSDDKKKQKAGKLIEQLEAELMNLRERYQAVKKSGDPSVSATEKSASTGSRELIMAALDARSPTDTELRVRGEAKDKGDKIPRGFLTVGSVGHVPKIGAGSGRRELAEYLTQADNPLTPRVAANRIWQHLLGRGIVATVDNFGVQGDPPTHPELLDWLASEMTSHDWSIKHLVRTIVTSRTYQLAAAGSRPAEKIDPSNSLLWRARHRRLEVEAIRDAMLSASGQLDLSPPSDGSVVAEIGDVDIDRSKVTSQLSIGSTRRSVYLPIVRLAVPDMLQVFDFPEPSNISGQRDVTTVATQALYLMNNDFVLQQAGQFADRLFKQVSVDPQARVDLAYRMALGRSPTTGERDMALEFIMSTKESLASNKNEADATSKAWTAFCQALFESAEFRYLE